MALQNERGDVGLSERSLSSLHTRRRAALLLTKADRGAGWVICIGGDSLQQRFESAAWHDFILVDIAKTKNRLAILGIDNPIWLGFTMRHIAPGATGTSESIVMKDHQSDTGTQEKITQKVLSVCEKYAP